MSFLLFLAYLVLNFVRPGELYPELASVPLMGVTSAAAIAGALLTVVLGRGPSLRIAQPYLIALFTLWAALSAVLAFRWLGGAVDVLDSLAPSLVLFALFYLNVGSFGKLRATAATLAALGVLVAAQSVYSYHTGWMSHELLYRERADAPDEEVPFEPVAPAADEAVDQAPAPPVAEGAPTDESSPAVAYVVRVRHLGFLHDPNDLAQGLTSILPLLVALRRPGRRARNVLLIWIPAGAILYAISLTRSRGAILALAVLAFIELRPRLGRTVSVVAGVLGAVAALAFGFAGGRSLSVDESAEGRLDAWREGLEMLKDSPVWGVGYGGFTEHNALVAHNSFVHCFSETGLVGYFLWLSTLGLTLYGLKRIRALAPPGEEGDAGRLWAHAVQNALVAFLVGAFFLSRTYGVMLFLLLGLGAATIEIGRGREWGDTQPPLSSWVPAVATATVTSIVGFWVLMKVFR